MARPKPSSVDVRIIGELVLVLFDDLLWDGAAGLTYTLHDPAAIRMWNAAVRPTSVPALAAAQLVQMHSQPPDGVACSGGAHADGGAVVRHPAPSVPLVADTAPGQSDEAAERSASA